MQHLKRAFNGYRFLFCGPAIIDGKAKDVRAHSRSYFVSTNLNWQADGTPFIVETPKNKHVIVTSLHHVKELAHGSPRQLSLHAIGKEVSLVS